MAGERKLLIFLLRGINVGGHKKVPMADLRALAESLGFEKPRTYIQSGNLICSTTTAASLAADDLSAALNDHFGFPVDVVVRTAEEWTRLAGGGPFPDAERERPKFLHLGLASRPPVPTAQDTLGKYVRGRERVVVDGDAVWIDYADGAGRSKLTPSVLDRATGATVTCRNWRTVGKLAELLRAG